MKKIFLTFAFVVATFISMQAQVWLGGSVNAQLNKDFKTFSIAPDVGYCFPNNPFSVACAIEYEGWFYNMDGVYSHSLTVSPYLRYDICDIEERFFLFVDLVSDVDALELSFFDIGLSPGVSMSISDHWSAEFSYGFLGYRWEKLTDQEIGHNFELDFKTAAAEFGIYYSFWKLET